MHHHWLTTGWTTHACNARRSSQLPDGAHWSCRSMCMHWLLAQTIASRPDPCIHIPDAHCLALPRNARRLAPAGATPSSPDQITCFASSFPRVALLAPSPRPTTRLGFEDQPHRLRHLDPTHTTQVAVSIRRSWCCRKPKPTRTAPSAWMGHHPQCTTVQREGKTTPTTGYVRACGTTAPSDVNN